MMAVVAPLPMLSKDCTLAWSQKYLVTEIDGQEKLDSLK